jgi:uracil-DNA glycosylase
MQAEEALKQISVEVQTCNRCDLQFSRKHGVAGDGPADAEIMFIGEGPGFHENEQGLPFVGAAGRFLDELLDTVGMQRKDVFIGNVVKCRPPSNRDPHPEELAACDSYLERQIQAINPKVIVTLGRFSLAKFIPNVKISDIHGKAMRVRGRLIVPMYHPAAALHQPSLKPVVDADFASLPNLMETAIAVAAPELEPETPEEKPDPKQLSMF